MYRCLFIILLFSCSDLELDHEEENYLIVKHEAEARGRHLPKFNLVFKSGISPDAFYDPNNNTIYIDTTSNVWNKFPEETMAHEIGHVIGRDHDFSRLPNGMYKSVMGNYSSCQYAGWTCEGSEQRRSYYYDELFNKNTGIPDWGQ